MNIHEKISLQSFPHLLASSYREKQTGTLIVRAGELTKNIYLENGSVIFASSNDRNDRLGEMLVRRGIISIINYLDASERVVPGKRFGTILVDMDLLTPEQLVWAVKEQVKEIVFSLFGELFISCSYDSSTQARDEMITLNINTPELLRQGILSTDRISWALSDLEKTEKLKVVKNVESIMNLLSLSKIEQEILFSINDGIKFRDIFTNVAKSVQSSILKFLWVLYVLGFIEKVKEPDKNQEEALLDVTIDDLT